MAMPNPAHASVPAQATQSYEIPPFRGDHRYEATLAAWTPSTVEFRIHLVNADRCGLPSSYSFNAAYAMAQAERFLTTYQRGPAP